MFICITWMPLKLKVSGLETGRIREFVFTVEMADVYAGVRCKFPAHAIQSSSNKSSQKVSLTGI